MSHDMLLWHDKQDPSPPPRVFGGGGHGNWLVPFHKQKRKGVKVYSGMKANQISQIYPLLITLTVVYEPTAKKGNE